jgi:hypothetical protein
MIDARTGIPIAYCEIVELKHDPGKYLLKISECPYCGKKHFHGLPKDGMKKRNFGHRVSHCGPSKIDNRGYFLVKAPHSKK